MDERLYTFAFRDETTNGVLSSNTIQFGASGGIGKGGEIKSGANTASTVFGRVSGQVIGKTVMQPLNQMTGGLAMPAISLGKSIFKGAGAGAIAGGVTAIAIKGIELIVNKIQQDIENLKQEARESNNNDNALISAGKLNVSNAKISYNKYGKAVYKYNRS